MSLEKGDSLVLILLATLVHGTLAQNSTINGPSSNSSDGYERALITILVILSIAVVSVIIAKILDHLYDRHSIRDDASDVSEHTRNLIKLRLALSKFTRKPKSPTGSENSKQGDRKKPDNVKKAFRFWSNKSRETPSKVVGKQTDTIIEMRNEQDGVEPIPVLLPHPEKVKLGDTKWQSFCGISRIVSPSDASNSSTTIRINVEDYDEMKKNDTGEQKGSEKQDGGETLKVPFTETKAPPKTGKKEHNEKANTEKVTSLGTAATTGSTSVEVNRNPDGKRSKSSGEKQVGGKGEKQTASKITNHNKGKTAENTSVERKSSIQIAITEEPKQTEIQTEEKCVHFETDHAEDLIIPKHGEKRAKPAEQYTPKKETDGSTSSMEYEFLSSATPQTQASTKTGVLMNTIREGSEISSVNTDPEPKQASNLESASDVKTIASPSDGVENSTILVSGEAITSEKTPETGKGGSSVGAKSRAHSEIGSSSNTQSKKPSPSRPTSGVQSKRPSSSRQSKTQPSKRPQSGVQPKGESPIRPPPSNESKTK